MTLNHLIVLESIVQIQSSTKLHDLGLLISNQLFGGIGFVHSESRDEIPCIQLDRPVLGLFAILAGIPPIFSLEIFTLESQYDDLVKLPVQRQFRDISDYIVQCLARNFHDGEVSIY